MTGVLPCIQPYSSRTCAHTSCGMRRELILELFLVLSRHDNAITGRHSRLLTASLHVVCMCNTRKNHNVLVRNVEQTARGGQSVQSSDAVVDGGPIHEDKHDSGGQRDAADIGQRRGDVVENGTRGVASRIQRALDVCSSTQPLQDKLCVPFKPLGRRHHHNLRNTTDLMRGKKEHSTASSVGRKECITPSHEIAAWLPLLVIAFEISSASNRTSPLPRNFSRHHACQTFASNSNLDTSEAASHRSLSSLPYVAECWLGE